MVLYINILRIHIKERYNRVIYHNIFLCLNKNDVFQMIYPMLSGGWFPIVFPMFLSKT